MVLGIYFVDECGRKGSQIVVLKLVHCLLAMFFILLMPLISSENSMHLGFFLESDGRNPALFILKICFESLSYSKPMD